MNKIYAIYDVHARYLRSLDIFPNDLVAFREYMLMVEKSIKSNPAVRLEDYKVLCLGQIDNVSDNPAIVTCYYEVTVEAVKEYLTTHKIGDK